jgi:dihydroorotase
MKTIKSIDIIQPDDWHTHFREGDLLNLISKFSARVNNRCLVMPNLNTPITTSKLAKKYLKDIKNSLQNSRLSILIPCYLTNNLDLVDFEKSLIDNVFIGAKLYPSNVTTNSSFGISNIEEIFPALEILQKTNKHLLIHGEKIRENIDIFDREKYFIDEELSIIRRKFPDLKIVLEHVSSKYGADFVSQNKNIAGTITPQHMLLTKKDVFFDDQINPHHYCMPIVKDEKDLIALRNYACSGNNKFFLGTDSAPHDIIDKPPNLKSKPGIFSAPCSIELYTEIFDQENSLENLESFSSINGPNFYNLPVNKSKIRLINQKWTLEECSQSQNIKVKNFYGGNELNWKVVNLNK